MLFFFVVVACFYLFARYNECVAKQNSIGNLTLAFSKSFSHFK